MTLLTLYTNVCLNKDYQFSKKAMVYSYLTHSFPMHPFFPYPLQKSENLLNPLGANGLRGLYINNKL